MTISGRLKRTDKIIGMTICHHPKLYVVKSTKDSVFYTQSLKVGSLVHESKIKYQSNQVNDNDPYFNKWVYLDEVTTIGLPEIKEN